MKRWAALAAVGVISGCGQPLTGDIKADYIESVVSDAKREALRRGKRDALDRFSVRVETSDKFGNEGDAPALSFSWTQADLDKVNWKGIADYQVLDLASVRIDHPNGVMALHDWCDENGRSLTPRLCGPERARAEEEWVSRNG